MDGTAFPHRQSSRGASSLRRMHSEAQINSGRPVSSMSSAPQARPRDHGQPSHSGFWHTVLGVDRPHPHPSLIPSTSFHNGFASNSGAASSGQVQPSYSFHVGAPTMPFRDPFSRPTTLPRRFYCSECDVSFLTLADLDAHKDRHHLRQQRPFQCSLCEVGFSQKSHLNQHIRTVHQKVRPHKCPQCDKAFGKKYDLVSHRDAVHANERPHACEFCDKRFAKRSNLTRHRSKLHADQINQRPRR